jgi:hypothetical protein
MIDTVPDLAPYYTDGFLPEPAGAAQR